MPVIYRCSHCNNESTDHKTLHYVALVTKPMILPGDDYGPGTIEAKADLCGRCVELLAAEVVSFGNPPRPVGEVVE